MTPKELYREFCQSNDNIPIFMTDWWMDAVCAGKEWDVLLSIDQNGAIQAAIPYLIRKRAWMRYIVMPQMTQIGGIWLRDDLHNNPTLILQICKDFTTQLDALKLAYYYQHYPIFSPTPNYMQTMGFRINKRTTYQILDLSNIDNVIEAFSKNKKRQLQKALSLHADTQMTAEEFYRFHLQCMRAQGKEISYTREFLLVLDRKTQRKNQSTILSIRNLDNQVLAAAFLVWDKHKMYYLIPCYDPTHKESGASALLVLEAIKLARKEGVIFDFEGSMIKGIANHYKQFGSTPTTYYSVEKYYKWYFWFANAYNWFKERKLR